MVGTHLFGQAVVAARMREVGEHDAREFFCRLNITQRAARAEFGMVIPLVIRLQLRQVAQVHISRQTA